MTEAAIVVATYGDEARWGALAEAAIASAEQQTVVSQTVYVHGDSLHEARNAGAAQTDSEWLIFLDADDTLDPHYVEQMLKGTGDLRQPMTLGVYPDGTTDAPVFIPPKASFADGNWMVIGTPVRRCFFEAAGGWSDEALYEDWALWWRCWLAGAEIGKAFGAIYRITVHPDGGGRNLPQRGVQEYWFRQIANTYSSLARAS